MRNLAIGLGILIILGAATAWLSWPPEYEACAFLRVRGQLPRMLGTDGDGGDFATFKRTQIQLIHSPAVVDRVLNERKIQTLGLVRNQPDPQAWLRDHLEVTNPDDSEIMRIALHGPNQAELKTVVDTVVDTYMSEIVGRERERRLETEAKLARSYEEYQKEVQKQMENLHTMEIVTKTEGTASANIKKELAEQKLSELHKVREHLQIALVDIELKIATAKARESSAGLQIERAAGPIENSYVGLLQSHQGTSSRDDADGLPVLEKQREHVEKQIERINAEIFAQAAAIESTESFSSSVASKRSELERLEKTVAELGTEIQRSKLERQAVDRVVPIDKATLVSTAGDSTRRNTTVLAATLVGLGLVVVGLLSGRRRPTID